MVDELACHRLEPLRSPQYDMGSLSNTLPRFCHDLASLGRSGRKGI
jgi:hypothetical protein